MSEKIPIVLVMVFCAVGLAGWGLFQPLLSAMADRRQADASGKQDVRLAGWLAALVVGALAGAGAIALGLFSPFVLAATILPAGSLAYQVPRLLHNRRLARRKAEFRLQLVDLTVGLATGLRAGGALGQSLQHLARESTGVMAEELNQVLRENALGMDFAECFARLSQRMASEDMTLLATAIRLTLTTGGSLAEVLEKMTVMMRDRREFEERVRTMTAQGRFEALVMGLAPLAAFGILFLIDRSMVEPLYTMPIGRLVMLGVVFLEGIGFYVINKIVTVEV